MATFKFIEATGENVKALQTAINDIDAQVQCKQEDIQAIAESIQMMLSEPDSPAWRLRINRLVGMVSYLSFECTNSVNCTAEEYGANYIDENERALERTICTAARILSHEEVVHV